MATSTPVIVSTPVNVSLLSAVCDQPLSDDGHCAGSLVSDGYTRPNRTPLGVESTEYRHKCDQCGIGVWLAEAYPKPVYTPRPDLRMKVG